MKTNATTAQAIFGESFAPLSRGRNVEILRLISRNDKAKEGYGEHRLLDDMMTAASLETDVKLKVSYGLR
jgi:hypothetical protein